MELRHPGYETTVITSLELGEEALHQVLEKLASVIKDFNGELVSKEDWGKKKLAYPIVKQSRGHYSHMVYTGKPGVVEEIERNLRITDHVLRFLSVKVSDEFDAAKYAQEKKTLQGEAKSWQQKRSRRDDEDEE